MFLYWIISTKGWEMSMYKSVKSKIAHFSIDNKKMLLSCTKKSSCYLYCRNKGLLCDRDSRPVVKILINL
jgi:putative lipase involved disintegration of autophagic bodies